MGLICQHIHPWRVPREPNKKSDVTVAWKESCCCSQGGNLLSVSYFRNLSSSSALRVRQPQQTCLAGYLFVCLQPRVDGGDEGGGGRRRPIHGDHSLSFSVYIPLPTGLACRGKKKLSARKRKSVRGRILFIRKVKDATVWRVPHEQHKLLWKCTPKCIKEFPFHSGFVNVPEIKGIPRHCFTRSWEFTEPEVCLLKISTVSHLHCSTWIFTHLKNHIYS